MILCLCKREKTRIPNESIRFRVIANSNLEEDQRIKKEIAENIFQALKPTQSFKDIKEARSYIQDQLPTFTEIVEKTLKDNKLDKTFHINYGKNFFPEKTYENEIYKAGEYESLVVTLGEGKGDNFWCVLFPPICFLDDNENIEYKSFFKELIHKYF